MYEPSLIRVIRLGAPPNGAGAVGDAHRIAIDDLPAGVHGKAGLQFSLHNCVPVFVGAAGAVALLPTPHWSLQRDGDKAALRVRNTVGSRAWRAALSFINNVGQRSGLTSGRLGYVPPGAGF